MAHIPDDLVRISQSAFHAKTSDIPLHRPMHVSAVFLLCIIIAAPNARSQEPPNCGSEPYLPTAPGTFGARPGSILSPGHRRSVHSLLSPPRYDPRCPPEPAYELDVPPPPQWQQAPLAVPRPKRAKLRVDVVPKRTDKPAPKRAAKWIGKPAGEALRSTARTQRALTAIGLPPDRIDGVLSSKTTHSIQSFQARLGAPTTGRLTKGQRELLWELSAATK